MSIYTPIDADGWPAEDCCFVCGRTVGFGEAVSWLDETRYYFHLPCARAILKRARAGENPVASAVDDRMFEVRVDGFERDVAELETLRWGSEGHLLFLSTLVDWPIGTYRYEMNSWREEYGEVLREFDMCEEDVKWLSGAPYIVLRSDQDESLEGGAVEQHAKSEVAGPAIAAEPKMLRILNSDNEADVEDLLRSHDVVPRRVLGVYSVYLGADGRAVDQEEQDARSALVNRAPAVLAAKLKPGTAGWDIDVAYEESV